MKKLLILVVLLAVIAFALLWGAGYVVEQGVERGGTWAFDTSTTLDGADLSLLGGQLELKGLTVANPPGFSAAHAFVVGDLDVKADLESLMTDTIEVPWIEVNGPELTMEVTPQGTNLGKLLDNLKQKSSTPPAEEPEGQPEAASKGFHVGRIVIDGARLHLAKSALVPEARTLTIPRIELDDVGGPVTLAELLERILGAILARGVGDGLLPPELAQLLDKERALEAIDQAKEQVGEIGSQVQKELEGLKGKVDEGLGGLLGGKKKQKDDQ